MKFPLTLKFKILALASQIEVTDADGAVVCYVRQKMFKLRERISVFADRSQEELVAEIGADRILDFSAAYTFTDPSGVAFGSVRRKGMRSLWRSHYDLFDGTSKTFEISEANPWAKVSDGLLGEIPVVGLLANYFFHPQYLIKGLDGTVCYTLTKKPALFEGVFELEENVKTQSDMPMLMGVLMMTLLERERG